MLFRGNYASNTALGIINVSWSSWNQMNVTMINWLSCSFARIWSNIKSLNCIIFNFKLLFKFFQLKKLKKKLEIKDDTIEGFNVGSNSGKTAGQSINHCHIHLIPRRSGDVDNPQGGVRSVIASKQHYVRKTK